MPHARSLLISSRMSPVTELLPTANVDLQAFNTLHLPVRAQRYVALTQATQLDQLVHVEGWSTQPRLILGGGSNIVFRGDFPGLVLHICTRGIVLLEQTPETVLIGVSAGENWHAWVEHALRHGWHGLENLALIPGTVGAAPVQNIGAYGVEVAQFVERVQCYDLDESRHFSLPGDACRFGYRDSVFKRELAGKALITRVDFRLSRQPRTDLRYAELQKELTSRMPTPRQVFDAVCAIRRRKLPDPAVCGNVGSFFKNPILDSAQTTALLARHPEAPHYPAGTCTKFAAAWLIEQCGFKGQSVGGAGVHPQHALVLINRDRACAGDIAELARRIQSSVYERFGIALEPEPLFV